jgi:hypothetical protein
MLARSRRTVCSWQPGRKAVDGFRKFPSELLADGNADSRLRDI